MKKHIFKSIPAANDVICAMLWELGEATSSSFFSSKYSFTKPTRALFGFDENFKKGNINKNTIKKNLERLVEQGFVEKKDKKFILSKEGIRFIEYMGLRRSTLKKKWDGKYRLVIFDIPEKQRIDRDWLREELYLLEYVQLQKSVFISKYPLVEDVICDIRKRKIDNYVNYLLVDKMFDYSKIEKISKKKK